MSISIRVNSVDAQREIARLPDVIGAGLRDGIIEVASQMLDSVREYPQPRRYRRTYNLRRSWSIDAYKTFVGFSAVVQSDDSTAPYNVLVQDKDRQSHWHRGYWATAQDIADKKRNGAPETVRQKIESRIRSN